MRNKNTVQLLDNHVFDHPAYETRNQKLGISVTWSKKHQKFAARAKEFPSFTFEHGCPFGAYLGLYRTLTRHGVSQE